MLNLRGQRLGTLVAGILLVVAAHCANAAVWRVVYDLDGTTLELRNLPLNLADQTHAVGPGYLIVDFSDNGSTIVDGPVQLRHYTLVQAFTSSTLGANVEADIFAEANFTGGQTLATGTLSNGVITWTQSLPYKITGTNTCTGNAFSCTAAGFTVNEPRDESREDPVTFGAFRYGAGGATAIGATFSADEVELPSDAQADTFLLLRAKEIRRKRIEPNASDGCLPFPDRGAHAADQDCSQDFTLNEVLRVVQIYNAGQYHCQPGSEDNYAVGPGNLACNPHSSDYQSGSSFRITLSELLRALQLFSLQAAFPCDGQTSEDGFCSN